MLEPATQSAVDTQDRAGSAGWGPLAGLERFLARLRIETVPASAEGALLRRIATLTSVFLLATLLISFGFWLPDRLYPLTPIFGLTLGDIAGKAILVALFLAVIPLTLWPAAPMPLFLIPSILLLLLIAADQSRMQPYIFMYVIALTVSAAATRSADKHALLDALRLLCAGAYFWSGLQKMNYEFVHSIFGWFMSPLRGVLPGFAYDTLMRSALLVPAFEALIGVLLVASPRKSIPLAMAACMLVTVLFCLGPLGHNWNIVVWPWNVWLFTMSAWLFWGQDVPLSRLFALKRRSAHLIKAVVLVLIGFLPMLSIAHYWDGYMSFKLYSGNIYQASVLIGEGDRQRLPPELAATASGHELTLAGVTFGLYEVAPYPERRVYLSVWRQWCEKYGLEDSKLVIASQSRFYGRQDRMEEFTCPVSP